MPSVKLVEFDLINCKMKQEHTLEFQAGNVWDAKIYSDESFNNPKIKGFDLEDCGEIRFESSNDTPRRHLCIPRSVNEVPLFAVGVAEEAYSGEFPSNGGTSYESAYIGTSNRNLHIGDVFGSGGVPDDIYPHMKINSNRYGRLTEGCKVQIDGRLKLNQYAKDPSYADLTSVVNNDNRSGLIIATQESGTYNIGASIILARGVDTTGVYYHSKIWTGWNANQEYLAFRCCGIGVSATDGNITPDDYDFRIREDRGGIELKYGNHTFRIYDDSSAWRLENTSTGASINIIIDSLDNLILNPGGGFVGIGQANPTQVLDVNGHITASGTITSSDNRVKHNEQDLSGCLQTISKLKPQKYIKTNSFYDGSNNYYGTDHHFDLNNIPEKALWEAGFIAQDVRNNIPELNHLVIGEEYVIDSSGNEIPNLLGMNYNSYHAYSIGAIQELHQLVLSLQERIKVLESSS